MATPREPSAHKPQSPSEAAALQPAAVVVEARHIPPPVPGDSAALPPPPAPCESEALAPTAPAGASPARARLTAHEQRVIHRVVSPASVLLAEDGAPKITDFGLPDWLEAHVLRPGVA